MVNNFFASFTCSIVSMLAIEAGYSISAGLSSLIAILKVPFNIK